MKGRSPDLRKPNLFKQRLKNQLNPSHPLYKLAEAIPWGYFEREFEKIYSDKGRPAKPR